METAFQVIASRGPANRDDEAAIPPTSSVFDETGGIIAKETFGTTLP